MGHRCGAGCKRKTGERCDTCRIGGTITIDTPNVHGKQATAQEIGAAVDMYFDGLSYRRTAENIGDYFDHPTNASTVYRWVKEQTAKAKDVVEETKVDTGPEWVADELQVRLGGEKYWIFNVMDSKTRFVLAAYLSRERTTRAAAAALSLARERAANAPEEIKTDGLTSYQQGVKTAFPLHPVKHVVSQGIRAEINNNLSERLQGTFRDRDKTLRGLKQVDSGQTYLDGLVLNYNYFRPHQSLDGEKPAERAGVDIPFSSWRDVAGQDKTQRAPVSPVAIQFRENAAPEHGYMYRAADDDGGLYWTQNIAEARYYADNPGFGGGYLWRRPGPTPSKIIRIDHVQDLVPYTSRPDKLDPVYGNSYVFDALENLPEITERLREGGWEWVQYPDPLSEHPDAQTLAYIGVAPQQQSELMERVSGTYHPPLPSLDRRLGIAPAPLEEQNVASEGLQEVLRLRTVAKSKNADWTVSSEKTPELWSKSDSKLSVKGIDAIRDYLEGAPANATSDPPVMHVAALDRYREGGKWYAHGPEPPNEVVDIDKVLSLLDTIEAGRADDIPPIVLLNETLAITGSHRLAASEIAKEYGYPGVREVMLDDLDIPAAEKERIRELVEEARDYDYAQSVLDEGGGVDVPPTTDVGGPIAPSESHLEAVASGPDAARLRRILVGDYVIKEHQGETMTDAAIIKRARDAGYIK